MGRKTSHTMRSKKTFYPKLMFTMALLLVFSISFSSALQFDNTKHIKDETFDGKDVLGNNLLEKYSPIEIKNNFGIGKRLFEGYLSEHTEICEGDYCYSEMEIYTSGDDAVVDDLIFKTEQKDKSWIEQNVRRWKLQYWGQIDDYEWQCEDTEEVSENGTKIQTCSNVKVGSHEGWIRLELGQVLPEGNYKIKLEAWKKPSRTIDWIIKTNGKWLDEWAIWGNTLGTYNESHNQSFWDGGGIGAGELGVRITIHEEDITLNNVTVYPEPNGPTKLLLKHENGTSILNTTTKTGYVFTFASDPVLNANTDYRIEFDNPSTPRHIWFTGINFVEGALMTWVWGSNGGEDFRYAALDILSLMATSSSEGLVTLNSPTDSSILLDPNNVQFNATATVTGGATLTNMSLWTNESGDWELRNITHLNLDYLDETIYETSVYVSPNTNIVGTYDPLPSFLSNNVSHLIKGNGVGGANGRMRFDYINGTQIWSSSFPTSSTSYVYHEYANPFPTEPLDAIQFALSDTAGTSYARSKDHIVNKGLYFSSSTQTWNRTITDDIIWNVQACDSDGDCGWATSNYSLFIDTSVPSIDILYPNGTLNYGYNGQNVTLNYSITDSNLDSCWYYYPPELETYGKTKSEIILPRTYYDKTIIRFNSSVENGNLSLNWSTNYGGTVFSSGNYSLSNCKTDLIYFESVDLDPGWFGSAWQTNFTCGGELIASVGTSCNGLFECTAIYNIEYEELPIVKELNCSETLASFLLEGDNGKNITLYANDSVGNEGNLTRTWDYNVFKNTDTYEEEVYETESTDFILDVTYNNSEPISAKLSYNGENYTSTNTGSGNNAIFTTSLSVPSVSSEENKTFHWIITWDGETIVLEEHNQTIKKLVLQFCNGTYPTVGLNFSLKDEETGILIDLASEYITFKSTIFYWLGNGNTKLNYSYQTINNNSKNTFAFCLGQNETIYFDQDIEYTSTSYSDRYWTYRNSTLSNETLEIDLYLLKNDDSTKFTTFVKQSTDAFQGAMIEIQKYFVGEGIYKTIQKSITNDLGTIIAYMDLDGQYNFLVSKDGIDYGTFEKQATCSETPCEITIQLADSPLSGYAEFYDYFAQNVNYDFNYNLTSNMVTLNFEDTTGTAQYWRLVVYQTYFNNETLTTICDDKTYSVSGTMECNFTGYTGDISAKIFISRSPEKLVEFIQWMNDDTAEILGITAILASIIIILVIVLSGVNNPVNALIMLPLALVILKLIKFLPLTWTLIAVITIFVIWIIKKLRI